MKRGKVDKEIWKVKRITVKARTEVFWNKSNAERIVERGKKEEYGMGQRG